MAELKNIEQAKEAFATLCQALDNKGWRYKKNEEKLILESGFRGDDLAIELTVKVDADRMVVLLVSHLPFVVQEDRRLDMAVAISAINNHLVDGCFDYNLVNGHIFFRMTNSILESKLSEDVFTYLLLCSCKTIDDFNEKLMMLARGMVTLEQFLSNILK